MRFSKRQFCVFAFLVTISLTCRFSAVDYATGDVQLRRKTKTSVEGKPAIALEVVNTGAEAVNDVEVIVNAKNDQHTLQSVSIFLDHLNAEESVEATAVFDSLRSHNDYDLLTFAVKFSR